jgi:ATP-binding cassette subfamily C protein
MPSTPSPHLDPAPAEPAAEREGALPAAGSTWETARRLVRFAAAVDPVSFWLTLATAVAGSLAEGTGLVLLLPLLSVAGMNFGGSSTAGKLSAAAQHLLVRCGIPHSLWLPAVLGIFLLSAAVRAVLRRSQSMLTNTTTIKVELALSERVYEAVVNAQWGFLVRQRSGRLTHLLTGELGRVAQAISMLLSLITLGCLTLLYLVVALKLSAPMTLLVLAMGGLLLLLERNSLERLRAGGEDLNEGLGEVYAATQEHLLNLKSVKTYNAEDWDIENFTRLCNQVARQTEDATRHRTASAFRFEMGSLAALGTVIFLALGVLRVEPAAMLLLLAIFSRLMPQLATLQSNAHEVASVLPAYDHVLAIEAECRAHAESRAPEVEATPTITASLTRELRLENVWFAYWTPKLAGSAEQANGPEYVLRGIDLPIEAGRLSAVVGPSGSGKSTIADLANGLLQPTRGRLLLDGHELGPAEMRQWRQQIGYVGQDTVLFHQSVRENLLWVRPQATSDELREALLLASADFVYDLPGGLETIVGDRGIMLSSGQRQRISLARALLRKPTLLILDEATNALDAENEARILDAIQEALRTQRSALTVLMIAHRASAIRRADRIFELDGGRIAHSGTWAELQIETR